LLDTIDTMVRPGDAPATCTECDILIIGGGPAGSTAAAMLAARGRQVVLLEKDMHPRFHIGESLLPRNLEILDKLGMREAVSQMGVHKPGAEFVSDEHGDAVGFNFADGIDKNYTYAYQVSRADFDAALFANAEKAGARVMQNLRVTEARFAAGQRATVVASDTAGQAHHFAPRFVLDASGRDTFLAGSLRTKQSNKNNNTAAAFGHFRNAECRTGDRQGFITVHLVRDGWFWMIPLPDDVMSVGFVGTQAAFKARRGTMKEFLLERIRASRTVSQRMQCAELIGDVTGTGNYSYQAQSAVGDGYMMIGDAFAFLDPIFSSGVLLAMTSGEMGAAVADTWLDNPRAGLAMARTSERKVRRAMKTLGWLVYRINTTVMRDMFMSPQNRFRMREGLVSLLAGNIHGRPELSLPVIAFKGAFYMLSLFYRFGYRLHPDGNVKPIRQWASEAGV